MVRFEFCLINHFLTEHCEFNLEKLKGMIPVAFATVDVLTIRKWELRSWRWMRAYAAGENAVTAAETVKKYKSHRRAPEKSVV
jgi:hypothetical protein